MIEVFLDQKSTRSDLQAKPVWSRLPNESPRGAKGRTEALNATLAGHGAQVEKVWLRLEVDKAVANDVFTRMDQSEAQAQGFEMLVHNQVRES